MASGAGLLVNQINSSGLGNIVWSLAPQVPFTQFDLPLNLHVAGIVAALGDQGTMNRLVPTADGVLFGNAADGTWYLGNIPTAQVPDPLTVGTIHATDIGTVTLEVSGTPTFTGLAGGTIVTNIGLDASNHLITGPAAHSSPAMYFENPSKTSGTSPNGSPTNGSPLVIGNELFDPDSIAHVQDSQTIVIDTTGTYRIDWGGYWAQGALLQTWRLRLRPALSGIW